MKNFIYVTTFPGYFHNYFQTSLAKKNLEKGIYHYKVYNLRDFANKRRVDDYPYGGGAGMLLKVEPIFNSVQEIKKDFENPYFLLLSPQGKVFKQSIIKEYLEKENLVFICGHYEGLDARVKNFVQEEISIGEFITMGGEIPSLVLTDALIRAIPGVIKEDSYKRESFTQELLDFDSYTRPQDFKGLKVPEVLLSGDHKKIAEWREENSREKTFQRNKKL